MSRSAVLSGARIIIGIILAASTLSKLPHMGVFEAVVALSGFVPGPVVPARRNHHHHLAPVGLESTR